MRESSRRVATDARGARSRPDNRLFEALADNNGALRKVVLRRRATRRLMLVLPRVEGVDAERLEETAFDRLVEAAPARSRDD